MILSLVNTGLVIAVCDSLLLICEWLRAFDFTIFSVFGFVGFVASVLFLCWMRTAILAGGIAVVRSGFCSVFFAKDGEWLRFLFNGDWWVEERLEQKKVMRS